MHDVRAGSSDSTESSSSVDQESDALNSTETDSEIEEKNTRLKGTGHEEVCINCMHAVINYCVYTYAHKKM